MSAPYACQHIYSDPHAPQGTRACSSTARWSWLPGLHTIAARGGGHAARQGRPGRERTSLPYMHAPGTGRIAGSSRWYTREQRHRQGAARIPRGHHAPHRLTSASQPACTLFQCTPGANPSPQQTSKTPPHSSRSSPAIICKHPPQWQPPHTQPPAWGTPATHPSHTRVTGSLGHRNFT
jgi:hypothetical protein